MSYYHTPKELIENNPAASIYQIVDKVPVAACICSSGDQITHFDYNAEETWRPVPKLIVPEYHFCDSYRLYNPGDQIISYDQYWMAIALETPVLKR